MIRPIELHVTSQQGVRESNEDVEYYFLNLDLNGEPIDPSKSPIDLFIICDGHGGSQVSKFVVPRISQILLDQYYQYPIPYDEVQNIFNRIQKSIINHRFDIGDNCGSTCLVVIRYMDSRRRESIQVFNVGDSRAILSYQGIAVPLTRDHKPDWPDEKRRINKVNSKSRIKRPIIWEEGAVRVNGLSVSRAFGDNESAPQITHLPDVFLYPLRSKDRFIVLACDGLWDVMTNDEVVAFVQNHVDDIDCKIYHSPGLYPSREVERTDCIARKLASYAIARGSGDNISIIIALLG